MTTLGHVRELWRYPVKSFQGEAIGAATVAAEGFLGDRAYAIRDAVSGHILSAKRRAELMQARAWTTGGAVAMKLPSGIALGADDPAAERELSSWLHTAVQLVRSPGGQVRAAVADEDGEFRSFPGSFFDSRPIHIVTTASLANLARAYPEGSIDRRRFRPNIVVETPDETGAVEQGWIGSEISIGPVRLRIVKACARCVMITHAQPDLPVDRGVLRTVHRELSDVMGVYAEVLQPGVVRVGLPLTTTPPVPPNPFA